MAAEMSRGTLYSLVIPNLGILYNVLSDLYLTREGANGNYGPWSVVIRWLRMSLSVWGHFS